MEAYFIVEFTYPDGHVEEIEQSFKVLRDAVEFGNGLLMQVANTERFHHRGSDVELMPPSFRVVKIENYKRETVYRR